uniref:Protein krueppel n=1 Tax=Glossina brevipalpis TaxID=37001 RepID=A0A1A9X1J4_9MUSC
MANEKDSIADSIEACRTCGIYYMINSNYLKPLFQLPVENTEMMLIRLELNSWNIEISENDGFPQHVCSSCILEFQKIFKFRSCCVETQEQFRLFNNLRQDNQANMKIKTELPDLDEENVCDFIYINDLSDNEYDEGATAVPFNIPHAPIKEELIEAAAVPIESTVDPLSMAEASMNILSSNIQQEMKSNMCASLKNKDINGETKSSQPIHVECHLCQNISRNQETHRLHMSRVHEIKDLECHICGKEFKNSTIVRLKFHLKWHNLNKHIRCSQCGFICKSRNALKEHIRALHARIKCKLCGKMLIAKKMKNHMRQHELTCNCCSEVFLENSDLARHLWQTHAVEYQQGRLNITFRDESALYKAEENMNDYELICTHCNEKFAQQSELELHIKQQHSQNKTNLLEMSIQPTGLTSGSFGVCGNEEVGNSSSTFGTYDRKEEIYVSSPKLTSHPNEELQVATLAQTNVIFDKCIEEESLDNISDNLEQESTQSGSTNESGSENNGNSYVNTHSFACAKCTLTFAAIEQLRSHYELHLTKKKKSEFNCHLCPKRFDLKFSLNRHMKKHTNASI